jgi:hypothetical protein
VHKVYYSNDIKDAAKKYFRIHLDSGLQ